MTKKLILLIELLSKIYDDKNKLVIDWNKNKENYMDNLSDDKTVNNIASFIIKNRVGEIVLKNCYFINDKKLRKLENSLKNKLSNTYECVSIEKLNKMLKYFNNDNLLFIKGTALCKLYPKEYTRYQVDIDLIVHSIDDMWDILRKNKNWYRYDRLKLYTSFNHTLSASIDLYPKEEGIPYVDVHVNPFEIWGSISYKSKMWDRKIKNENYYVPSYEDMLLLIASHIGTQWMYRIRDINDVYILLNKKLDWKYINDTAKVNNLTSILKVLFSKIKKMYNIDLFDKLDGKNELNLSEKIFAKNNYGNPNVYTATPIESIFVYKYYRFNYSLFKSIYNSLKNTKNLVLYKNRAYKINKKRKIKKFSENNIIVLKEADLNISSNDKLSRIINNTLKIYNEGKNNEFFCTPVGKWIQSSYYID